MRVTLLIAFILQSATGTAASDARIELRVTDATGRPVAGARVWIGEREQRPPADWSVMTGVSGADNRVVFVPGRGADPTLRPWFGRYRLGVSAPGFATAVQGRVFLVGGERSFEVSSRAGAASAAGFSRTQGSRSRTRSSVFGRPVATCVSTGARPC